ncbi:MAG: hypothetical protein KGL39_10440 [Patescibacteria group bacterium]|nr:hypothetical protein [Patescibacteria group bacterium]
MALVSEQLTLLTAKYALEPSECYALKPGLSSTDIATHVANQASRINLEQAAGAAACSGRIDILDKALQYSAYILAATPLGKPLGITD